jgi:TRAP-type uncharacterized transport system fused permease subunit
VTQGFTWAAFFETTIGCLVGIVMLAAALTGYGLAFMRTWERVLLGIASILVIAPSRTATIVGLLLSIPVILRQVTLWRAGEEQALPMVKGQLNG